MPLSSPGPGTFLWSASTDPKEVPVDLFLRNGISSVPVALVPNNDGIIRMKNPKIIQAELRSVTAQYQSITEVRQFGRGGILCFSPDQSCVLDLLKCSTFASQPVSAFIPSHLACTRGLVRGVDANMPPSEVLELFSPAGAISVYRCGRVVDKNKIPTESVIVTFAGSVRPSEIKAWPLIYRVEPLSPRPLQCIKCWRYGHTMKGCRSAVRCKVCGEGHNSSDCLSDKEKCCLCSEAHAADSSSCSAKVRELQILEIVERRRCSRKEAALEIQARTQGYAGVTARNMPTMEALSVPIAEAIEKAVEKAMERIAGNLCESLAQILSNQMAQMLGTAENNLSAPRNISDSSEFAKEYDSATPQQATEALHIRDSPEISKKYGSDTPQQPTVAADSVEEGSVSQCELTRKVEDSDEMEMDPRSLKRSRSPLYKKGIAPVNSKTKKYQKNTLSKADFLKENILNKAIAEAILEQK